MSRPFAPEVLGKGLSLLTDLYELTMAQSYYLCGMTETEAVFHLFFRSTPFKGGYTIAAGLEPAVEWVRSFKLSDEEIEYLAGLPGNDGTPLFRRDFLEYLRGIFPLQLDIDAVPEGSIVHPNEPLLRVRGPILQAQIAETPLLCLINFYTLAATKAARITQAATVNGVMQPVLEFGLRRAQGMDGGMAASRAAYIGGCSATSNTLAGFRYGIPVAGTHAHSWIQSFADETEVCEGDANSTELTAFREFARTSPNNVVLLVDTYDTIEGVRHAIMVGKELREKGIRFAGIRLDSGDLAWLSKEARRMLDEAGFTDTRIYASNDLDEYLITSLRDQGAQIACWGVGTKMVTCYDQPTIGGVYKLSATRKAGQEEWTHNIKLSELKIKISNPGMLNVRRFKHNGKYIGDIIYDELLPTPPDWTAVDNEDSTRQKKMPEDAESFPLLVPVLRKGELVYEFPPLKTVREHTLAELECLPPEHKRFEFPHIYIVGLEPQLYILKNKLIKRERDRVRLAKGLDKHLPLDD